MFHFIHNFGVLPEAVLGSVSEAVIKFLIQITRFLFLHFLLPLQLATSSIKALFSSQEKSLLF